MKYAVSILFALFCTTYVYAFDAYDKYLTLLGFKLEETDLIEIREKLGDVPLQHTGDAAESYYAICYRIGNEGATVFFESGEMGGGNHTLLSFVVKDTVDGSQQCGKLYTNLHYLTVGNIELGMDFELAKEKIPKPLDRINNGVRHIHIRKIPFTEEDIERTGVKDMKYAFWDVSILIEVFEKNGVVTGYKVGKVTSW